MRVALVLALAACGSSTGGGSAGPAGKRVGPALAAMLSGADHTIAPWRCAAADLPAIPDESLAIAKRSWQLGGHRLALDVKESPGSISIGVIADAGGAAPATIAALGRLRAKLDVDLVIALGAMGGDRAALEATIAAIGGNDRPVIVLPGDLEDVRDHVAAIAALRQKGVFAIDGRSVRWIELPGATIGTLPGALDPSRLVPGAGGCALAPSDIASVFAELAKRDGMRIAASAEAPRSSVDGEPIGDRALGPATGQLDVHLFGASDAVSSKRDGKRDGSAVALAPGAADATVRLPPRRGPSAGILVVKPASWSWTPIVDSP